MIQNCKMTDFGKKIRASSGPIIFGTECDIDKPFFFLQKEGVYKIALSIIKRDQTGLKYQKEGQYQGSSLTPSSMGVLPPPSPQRLGTDVYVALW